MHTVTTVNTKRPSKHNASRKRKKASGGGLVLLLVSSALLAFVYVFFFIYQKDSSDLPLPSESTPITSQATTSVSLAKESIHSGELILINYQAAYDFGQVDKNVRLSSFASPELPPVCDESIKVNQSIVTDLKDMISGCLDATGENVVVSGYRTYEEQNDIFNEYVINHGIDYAKAYAANPGQSEHHSGLAVDLGILNEDIRFGQSDASVWMRKNCHKYGFILRYTDEKSDITKISGEAWHFRYVGRPHAEYMAENKLCLEQYIKILKSTSANSPLRIHADDTDYCIYYTDKESAEVPTNCKYSVSGNNTDRFIITVLM